MKNHHWIIGGIVLVVGGYGLHTYLMSKKHGPGDPVDATGQYQTDRSAASGYFKGYSNLMKLPPEYYNNTSMEGSSYVDNSPESYNAETGLATPWVLPANGGDGSSINPGWTAYPDDYSAKVSSFWLRQAVAGSHN